MIGKKNIVFGLAFFIFTASLGVYMQDKLSSGDVAQAYQDRKTTLGELINLRASSYEKDLESLPPEDIAKAAVNAVIDLNNFVTLRQEEVNNVRAGPHAHGNLESMLNIIIGILLCFLGVSRMFKQLISWAFILGAVLHSGMLFLRVLFTQFVPLDADSIVLTVANTAIYGGPPLLLLGLLLTVVAAIIGFRGEVVHDTE